MVAVSLKKKKNEFPDRIADEKTGKRHMVVRLGARLGARLHMWLILTPYIALACGIAFKVLPVWTSLGFLTLPLMVMSSIQLRTNLGDVTKLTPASALTVMSQFLMGILLTTGFII